MKFVAKMQQKKGTLHKQAYSIFVQGLSKISICASKLKQATIHTRCIDIKTNLDTHLCKQKRNRRSFKTESSSTWSLVATLSSSASSGSTTSSSSSVSLLISLYNCQSSSFNPNVSSPLPLYFWKL